MFSIFIAHTLCVESPISGNHPSPHDTKVEGDDDVRTAAGCFTDPRIASSNAKPRTLLRLAASGETNHRVLMDALHGATIQRTSAVSTAPPFAFSPFLLDRNSYVHVQNNQKQTDFEATVAASPACYAPDVSGVFLALNWFSSVAAYEANNKNKD